jgi:hypothetical protein
MDMDMDMVFRQREESAAMIGSDWIEILYSLLFGRILARNDG